MLAFDKDGNYLGIVLQSGGFIGCWTRLVWNPDTNIRKWYKLADIDLVNGFKVIRL